MKIFSEWLYCLILSPAYTLLINSRGTLHEEFQLLYDSCNAVLFIRYYMSLSMWMWIHMDVANQMICFVMLIWVDLVVALSKSNLLHHVIPIRFDCRQSNELLHHVNLSRYGYSQSNDLLHHMNLSWFDCSQSNDLFYHVSRFDYCWIKNDLFHHVNPIRLCCSQSNELLHHVNLSWFVCGQSMIRFIMWIWIDLVEANQMLAFIIIDIFHFKMWTNAIQEMAAVTKLAWIQSDPVIVNVSLATP